VAKALQEKLSFFRPDYIPNKRECLQRAVQELKAKKEGQKIPDVVQGEIARLDSRFKMKIDQTHNKDDGTIRILCSLGKKLFAAY